MENNDDPNKVVAPQARAESEVLVKDKGEGNKGIRLSFQDFYKGKAPTEDIKASDVKDDYAKVFGTLKESKWQY